MSVRNNEKSISKENSIKFHQLYFLLSFLVVFIHSYTYYQNENSIQWVFQKVVSDNIGRIAVPFFFTFSGFFLFLKYDNCWENYKNLVIKKNRSLVIPYFLWSCITFCLMYCMQLFNADFNQELIINKSLAENILSVLKGENTILWFVRILFFMNLLAPIVKIVIDKALLYIPVLALLFFLDFTNNNINTFVFKSDSFLFFILGGVLSQNKHLLDKRFNAAILLTISVLFAIGNIYSDYGTTTNVNNVNIFERFFILSFSLFIWNWGSIYSLIAKVPSKLYHYSFTIYIFHAHIIVIVIKKILSSFISIPIVVYLLTGFITFVFCLFLSVFLEKYFPRFYGILSGSRKSKGAAS